MKKSARSFGEFWNWLCAGPHQVNNLGCRKGLSFSIRAEGDKGCCTPGSSRKPNSFSKEHAQRVWDRYHGIRIYSDRGQGFDLHVKATSYAQPNKKGKSRAWDDFPNKTCSPWIAAAIAFALNEHPCPEIKHEPNQKKAKC